MMRAFRCSTRLATLVLFVTLSGGALAQQIIDGGAIALHGDAERASVQNALEGHKIVEYRFRGQAGQIVQINFQASSRGGAYTVLPPGPPGAVLYDSAGNGGLFEGNLPVTGDYRIRVYLDPQAAARGDFANYALSLQLSERVPVIAADPAPRPAAPGGDDLVIYAPEVGAQRGNQRPVPPDPGANDGVDDGAPPIIHDDYAFHILGLPPGEALAIRSGAGPQFRIIGQLQEGDPVDNAGCMDVNAGYWCRIATVTRPRISGWVNGRYVTDEGSGRPPGGAFGFGLEGSAYDAVGPLNCQYGEDGRMSSCDYGIVRNGTSSQLDLTAPDGSRRTLEYRAGRFYGGQGVSGVESRKQGGDAVVTINGNETYYIPDSVVMGE